MDKVKPLTIGIIALLLILLVFNFIPSVNPLDTKHLKTAKKTESQSAPLSLESQDSLAMREDLSQSNVDLIQKNIDFLKANIERLKQENAEKAAKEAQIESQNTDSNLSTIPQEATQNLQTTQIPKIVESNLAQTTLPQQTIAQNPKISQCVRHKPQLAIIIDDIGSNAQYQALSKIPFKLTPSFFPKGQANPDTPKLAQNAPFYMVHLPLEALNFYQKEHEWLFVGDSKAKIKQRIQSIKQDFPNLAYINNHTGSKFTQDMESMTLLLEALNASAINFVDSKTIGNTKATAAYAKVSYASTNPCQQTPLVRDVFLDNSLEIPAITQQLISAVQIAKTKGYAIAIGHPHKETFMALKNAEDYLAKSGVELVYINEIITP